MTLTWVQFIESKHRPQLPEQGTQIWWSRQTSNNSLPSLNCDTMTGGFHISDHSSCDHLGCSDTAVARPSLAEKIKMSRTGQKDCHGLLKSENIQCGGAIVNEKRVNRKLSLLKNWCSSRLLWIKLSNLTDSIYHTTWDWCILILFMGWFLFQPQRWAGLDKRWSMMRD